MNREEAATLPNEVPERRLIAARQPRNLFAGADVISFRNDHDRKIVQRSGRPLTGVGYELELKLRLSTALGLFSLAPLKRGEGWGEGF
jgi:hypothetical protein